MVWLVKTEYCTGIFLSEAAANTMSKKMKLQKIEYESYAEAYETMKSLVEKWTEKFSWGNFVPNRLYQIKSRKCYIVFYNKNKVGFTKKDNIDQFCDQDRIDLRFFRAKRNLDYETALSIVNNLGANTGKSKILEHYNPRINKLYVRRK